jgi:exodeoxyribonuclease V gamma subunit
VRHLALNASGGPADSHLLTREQTVRLAPPPDALARLADLLALARQGLCEPLPLLPESALAYLHAKTPEAGLNAARRAWEGNAFQSSPGEREEADMQVAFRGREPLAEPAFTDLARRVFGPLLAVLEGL